MPSQNIQSIEWSAENIIQTKAAQSASNVPHNGSSAIINHFVAGQTLGRPMNRFIYATVNYLFFEEPNTSNRQVNVRSYNDCDDGVKRNANDVTLSRPT